MPASLADEAGREAGSWRGRRRPCRCSAPEPCGGIIPIWRAKVIESLEGVVALDQAVRTVRRSKPSRSTGLPVGAIPPKRPAPQRAREPPLNPAALALGGRGDDLHVEVRIASISSPMTRDPVRRDRVHLAAHVLAPALRPQGQGSLDPASIAWK